MLQQDAMQNHRGIYYTNLAFKSDFIFNACITLERYKRRTAGYSNSPPDFEKKRCMTLILNSFGLWSERFARFLHLQRPVASEPTSKAREEEYVHAYFELVRIYFLIFVFSVSKKDIKSSMTTRKPPCGEKSVCARTLHRGSDKGFSIHSENWLITSMPSMAVVGRPTFPPRV